jgi:prephenate dehydratase/prephenate dehydrogenase
MVLAGPEVGTTADAPLTRLVVVGAVGAMGRWLCRHLFSFGRFSDVLLVDRAQAVHDAENYIKAARCRTATIDYEASPAVLRGVQDDDLGIDLQFEPWNVCFAVPQHEIGVAARALLPNLHASSAAFHTCSVQVPALRSMRSARPGLPVFGIHPLFGPSVGSLAGQTLVICPPSPTTLKTFPVTATEAIKGGPVLGGGDRADGPGADTIDGPAAYYWLAELVTANGGEVEIMPAEDHDEIMSYVQAASHQALLSFAGVLSSCSRNLTKELWRYRTPLFEALLGLTSRVLSPGQEVTIASIQGESQATRIASELAVAQRRLSEAVCSGSLEAVRNHIAEVREGFGGTFFASLQDASTTTIEVIQRNRARLATQWKSGELAGIRRRSTDTAKPVVGHIVDLSSTSVTIEVLLRGSRGRAVLLTDAGVTNARKLGFANGKGHTNGQLGSAREERLGLHSVTLALGNTTVLSEADLGSVLDDWLARLPIDARLFVPESVSGKGVIQACRLVQGVDDAWLISECLRLGQREVVVRLSVRADRDVQIVRQRVADQMEALYSWPVGLVACLRHGLVDSIACLGPEGTFSEMAAARAAKLYQSPDAALHFAMKVHEVVLLVARGRADIGVVPLISSSSGLFDETVRALSGGELEAGGIVDVPVRFDAYGPEGHANWRAKHLLRAYSHPQGIAQCSRFISRFAMEPVACDSTAAACVEVAQKQDGLALAATGQGERYGLHGLERDVGDFAGAITRFVVIATPGRFEHGEPDDPTYRSLWVNRAGDDLGPSSTTFRHEELMIGPDGAELVTTTGQEPLLSPNAVFVGRLPWVPRAPVCV